MFLDFKSLQPGPKFNRHKLYLLFPVEFLTHRINEHNKILLYATTFESVT